MLKASSIIKVNLEEEVLMKHLMIAFFFFYAALATPGQLKWNQDEQVTNIN